MAKSGIPWKRPALLGLLVAFTAVRVPDVLAEGTWRSWVVVPVFVVAVWLFGSSVSGAVRRGRDARRQSRFEAGD
ncbi:hypothetical protein GCM10007977_029670 [Dactylosporangium sucinum]|uniref:Uncharacterized protein n=1 Tax=Dactylosporangium sucinum TaxID=1424081 RepID=A0A917TKG6_9ACTN|nr:hypothetical protein GCM10007977_029670 [Dactylosporangium sucinum]